MPVDDDFNIFTEDDKRSTAYRLCVMGHMAIGATMGSLAGGQTLLGAAAGTAWGLFTCKALQEPIKKKLFSSAEPLTESELKQALSAVKQEFPFLTKKEALEVIAGARIDAVRNPAQYRSA